MSSATVLSQNDRAILGALFDPESSLDRGVKVQQQPQALQIPGAALAAEQEAVRLLNSPSPLGEDVHSAIAQLTVIIDKHSEYASAYVNRAQAQRLLPYSESNLVVLKQILADLDAAISLSSPASPSSSVSSYDARVLASAHTHRGYYLLRASTSPTFLDHLVSLEIFTARTPGDFEELASRDFSIAGRYGNKTAQQLAVKTNPYAKLCGQIVKEALQREIKEYYAGCGVTAAQ